MQMDQTTSKSIVRWVFSFLLLDIILGVYLLASCVADPDLCGVGSVFAVGFFYGYPFGILLPHIGAWHGLNVSVFIAPVVGILTHAALGIGIGYRMRNRVLSWGRIISIALAISLSLSFIPALLMSYIGLLNA